MRTCVILRLPYMVAASGRATPAARVHVCCSVHFVVSAERAPTVRYLSGYPHRRTYQAQASGYGMRHACLWFLCSCALPLNPRPSPQLTESTCTTKEYPRGVECHALRPAPQACRWNASHWVLPPGSRLQFAGDACPCTCRNVRSAQSSTKLHQRLRPRRKTDSPSASPLHPACSAGVHKIPVTCRAMRAAVLLAISFYSLAAS